MEWRVLGWLPSYEISEFGDVRRIGRDPEKFMKGRPNHDGYIRFNLAVSRGNPMTLYSHRLCCEAFHGPSPSDKREVAHWDGNPSNNHFSNLRWASASENGLDRVRHGRKRGAMKLANEQVLRIKSIDRCAHAQRNSLARELGISQSWAWKIANGKWWRHLNSQG